MGPEAQPMSCLQEPSLRQKHSTTQGDEKTGTSIAYGVLAAANST